MLALNAAKASAGVLITFEGLGDLDPVGNAYAGVGVTFANATVLKAGVSLNELEFPPYSMDNVVMDDGGPILGVFSVPAVSVGARFTYSVPVTLTAYNGGTILGTASSTYPMNYVSTGLPPNEFLFVSSATPITRFTIEGGLTGNSFVMDNFVFAVPEPASVGVAAAIGLASFGWCRVRQQRRA